MDHVAIMRKRWKLVEKILSGAKTIESRWYQTRRQPYGRITQGETVYFKGSGGPVWAKATVAKVLEFSDLDQGGIAALLARYGREIGIEENDHATFLRRIRNSRYAILVFLDNPREVAPFLISKKGFGNMTSWLIVPSIEQILSSTL